MKQLTGGRIICKLFKKLGLKRHIPGQYPTIKPRGIHHTMYPDGWGENKTSFNEQSNYIYNERKKINDRV